MANLRSVSTLCDSLFVNFYKYKHPGRIDHFCSFTNYSVAKCIYKIGQLQVYEIDYFLKRISYNKSEI